MRKLLPLGVMTVVLCAWPPPSAGQDAALPSPAHEEQAPRDAQGVRRAFETLFDAEDHAGIAQLMKEHARDLVALFKDCTRVWIERTGEAGEREARVMAKARALAEAADEALEALGLIEVFGAIEGWSDADREAWRRARAAYVNGRRLCDTFRWQDAHTLLGEACETFEQLGDAMQLADAASVLSVCCNSLGQYQEAIEQDTRVLEIDVKVGISQNVAFTLNNLGGSYLALGQYEKAIEYFERSLELKKAARNQDIASSPRRSLLVVNKCPTPRGHLVPSGFGCRASTDAVPLVSSRSVRDMPLSARRRRWSSPSRSRRPFS